MPGAQHVMRLHAPRLAAAARAGSFVHLRCHPLLDMRRPMSVMRVDPEAGWVEVLYKAIGHGTRLLAERRPGDEVSVLGPIGRPFEPMASHPRALLLGGGVGIPPMVFLAETLRARGGFSPLVLMGSEVPFPFRARPSTIIVPGMPDGAIAAMPLMEDWGIPSRLASAQGYPGCHDGFVTDLARVWLERLAPEQRAEVAVYACGPTPMLAATAALARDLGLPCQVSLEEYMACAVGGCAGCVVRIRTDQGPAMKRVCVDGPVFDAASVVWS
ncbi:MAG: dihydroorotate dehydrogenase electron transfer subunit [Ectothiorhodospiraceae bacterium]|nr:dihydroorotate dehydrogenase electron transfer subunit [Chromatiales bacterium]MCP5157313.1 dihydroorotate dehydrogenase electron transfer subunit [Ectothiorhodospiraceae bacterium]